MAVPIYGNLDHLSLELMPIDLFHTLSPSRLSMARADYRRAQDRPRSKGGQYQSAGEGAAFSLPLYFLDPFLYQRDTGFIAVHFADSPSPRTPCL